LRAGGRGARHHAVVGNGLGPPYGRAWLVASDGAGAAASIDVLVAALASPLKRLAAVHWPSNARLLWLSGLTREWSTFTAWRPRVASASRPIVAPRFAAPFDVRLVSELPRAADAACN
jgi:hypothetical protein